MLGIRPGDRVMIASENSVALSAFLFAASKLDAWPISVNPRLSARELDQIGAHSGARRAFFVTGLSQEADGPCGAARRIGADDRSVRRHRRRPAQRRDASPNQCTLTAPRKSPR